MSDQIRVLLVDADEDRSAETAKSLQQAADRIVVETAQDVASGLELVAERDINCVVTDHELQDTNGVELLSKLRDRDPKLPVILYTANGSEDVASSAISAGVTDYFQRGGERSVERLSDRVTEVAASHHTKQETAQTQSQLQAVTDHSRDAILIIDGDSTIRFANPAVERLFGYDPAELVGEPLSMLMSEAHAATHHEALERYVETGERTIDWADAEFPGRRRDGTTIPLSISFGEFTVDGDRRFVGIIRDITEREKHRAFVQHSSDIVAVLDAAGRFRYLSPSVEHIAGYTPTELVGENAFEYIHPADRKSTWNAFKNSIDDDTTTEVIVYRFTCADGEYRWFESVGTSPITHPGVNGYVVNTRDISDRKQREHTLEQLHEWTRQLNYTRTTTETTQLAVDAVEDIIGAELSGIHLLNEAGDALEPVALTDSVAVAFDELPSYQRDPAPDTRAALAWEAYRGDEPIEIAALSTSDRISESSPAESLVLYPIGDHGLFIISASTANAFSDTDVLIAKILANHLEAALDRVTREQRLARLHDATRELVQADTTTALAEQIVAAAEDVLGFSVVAVREYDEAAEGLVPLAVSATVEDITELHDAFRPNTGSLTWEAYDSGSIEVYDDIETVDHVPVDVEVRSLMLLPIGAYGILSVGEMTPDVFDDTDEFLARILATAAETAFDLLARTERLHERSAELARQNDRLAEFASVVSHDLRNPLNVAQGRIELARDTCDSEHLDHALTAHERMDTLISDLLTLAREGERVTDTQAIQLSAVASDSWHTVETPGWDLVVEDDMSFLADPGRLQQLFENLFRNAVEHGSPAQSSADTDSHGDTDSDAGSDSDTDSGPDVQSAAEQESPTDPAGTIWVGWLPDADGFFVEDDGAGIPPDIRDQVFDAGFSTGESGTGFGLRIVDQVADAHGWDVAVTDGRTGGARFEIRRVTVAD